MCYYDSGDRNDTVRLESAGEPLRVAHPERTMNAAAHSVSSIGRVVEDDASRQSGGASPSAGREK